MSLYIMFNGSTDPALNSGKRWHLIKLISDIHCQILNPTDVFSAKV